MADLYAVLAHKDFEYPNNIYFNFEDVKCYSQKKIKTNLPFKKYKTDGYDDKLFGELPLWIYLFEHETKYEWLTLNHYRRHMVEMYHNLSIAQPIYFQCSILQQTAWCHSPKVVELLNAVLSKEDFELLSRLNYLIPYNIMHVNRIVLGQWLAFVKPIIDKCVQLVGITDHKQMVEQMKNDNTFTGNVMPNGQVNESKNCDPNYQARLYAFILERLHTLFWTKALHGGTPLYYCEVELLETGQKI